MHLLQFMPTCCALRIDADESNDLRTRSLILRVASSAAVAAGDIRSGVGSDVAEVVTKLDLGVSGRESTAGCDLTFVVCLARTSDCGGGRNGGRSIPDSLVAATAAEAVGASGPLVGSDDDGDDDDGDSASIRDEDEAEAEWPLKCCDSCLRHLARRFWNHTYKETAIKRYVTCVQYVWMHPACLMVANRRKSNEKAIFRRISTVPYILVQTLLRMSRPSNDDTTFTDGWTCYRANIIFWQWQWHPTARQEARIPFVAASLSFLPQIALIDDALSFGRDSYKWMPSLGHYRKSCSSYIIMRHVFGPTYHTIRTHLLYMRMK